MQCLIYYAIVTLADSFLKRINKDVFGSQICIFHLQSAHLALIDALMKAYASEIASVERVVQAVR